VTNRTRSEGDRLYTLVLEFDGACYCDECRGGPIPDMVDFFDSPVEVGQALSDLCAVYVPSRVCVEVGGDPATDVEMAVVNAIFERDWGKPFAALCNGDASSS
jgi:hypothetical protein